MFPRSKGSTTVIPQTGIPDSRQAQVAIISVFMLVALSCVEYAGKNNKVNSQPMEIFFAETVVGTVRIHSTANALAELDFIDLHPTGTTIPIPNILQQALGAERVGQGSILCPNGTPFQLEVWNALLKISCGETLSYGELAARIGRKGSAQAVGQAVGANRLALLIPCHRVIASSGKTSGFRWGVSRKRKLLELERDGKDRKSLFLKFFSS